MAGLEPARANYSPTDSNSVAEPNVDASSVRTTLVACPIRIHCRTVERGTPGAGGSQSDAAGSR
jgi:hypothetical protein